MEPFGNSVGPADEVLRNAAFIDLARASGSAAAMALVDAVTDLTLPLMSRERSLGVKGRMTFKAQMGAILGGLLRAGYKGRAVSAQRRRGGFMWTGALMGNQAFWGKVDALLATGLVGERKGLTTNEWTTDDPLYGGLPTRLWPTEALMTLADHCGLSSGTVAEDWPVSRAAETRRVRLRRPELVVCRALEGPGKAELTTDGRKAVAVMAGRVEAVNTAIRAADIRGCPAVALRRIFRHDPRLGGRLYAVGGHSYQMMGEAERAAIRIDDAAVAEIDVSASALTVLLGLCGVEELPERDLYVVSETIPRDVVKAWMTQSLGSGRPAARWAEGRGAEIRAHSAASIRKAVFSAYPALSGPWQSVLPPDLAQSVPEKKRGWAVGQYVAFIESEIIEAAVVGSAREGVVALPVYDSLIVRASEAERAEAALVRAFRDRVGLTPRLHR